MSHTDRLFTLIAVAVVLAVTVGLWLTNLLWYAGELLAAVVAHDKARL